MRGGDRISYPLAIGLLIGVLFLLFQLMPYLSSLRARGKQPAHLKNVVPDSVLKQPRYLLYFWSPHCGMCRGMTPVIEQIMQQHNNLAKIDISKALSAARAMGVSATPALVVVDNGVIEKVLLGQEQKIRSKRCCDVEV